MIKILNKIIFELCDICIEVDYNDVFDSAHFTRVAIKYDPVKENMITFGDYNAAN